jgi:hypothetical protein
MQKNQLGFPATQWEDLDQVSKMEYLDSLCNHQGFLHLVQACRHKWVELFKVLEMPMSTRDQDQFNKGWIRGLKDIELIYQMMCESVNEDEPERLSESQQVSPDNI